MTRLWSVVGSISSSERAADLNEYDIPDGLPRIEYVNLSEVMQRLREVIDVDMIEHEAWDAAGVAFRAIPEPVLRITDPDFRLDYFFISQEFVSARLRAACNLGPDVVLYRDVALIDSSKSAQEQRFNLFHVVRRANPFDPAKMPGKVRPVRQEDGSLHDEWIPETPQRPLLTEPIEICFREDFQPPAPIFRTVGWDFTLATDEFAEQVMRAGITDLAFLKIDGPPRIDELIFRQIR